MTPENHECCTSPQIIILISGLSSVSITRSIAVPRPSQKLISSSVVPDDGSLFHVKFIQHSVSLPIQSYHFANIRDPSSNTFLQSVQEMRFIDHRFWTNVLRSKLATCFGHLCTLSNNQQSSILS